MLEEKLQAEARKLNVLYVEDEPVSREMMKLSLDLYFNKVMVANDGMDGLQQYRAHAPHIDVVISDISMPRLDGLQMVQQIREQNIEQSIIIVSAHDDTECLLRAIDLGVDRFLVKPVYKDRLVDVLYRVTSNINRDRELKATEKLYSDALTGLPNRMKMLRTLEELETSSLFIINIDDFKAVNKYYGYDVGNHVLKEMGARLEQLLPPERGAAIYRFPAGEFGMLLTEALPQQELEKIAQQICLEMDEQPFTCGDFIVNLTTTVGVAAGLHQKGEAKQVLNADIALEQARTRKMKYLLYEENLRFPEDYEMSITWLQKIKKAVKEDRICAYFQPIVNNSTGEVEKYECLVRMMDSDGTVVPAGLFLGVAQKSIFFREITKTVLRDAFNTFPPTPYKFSVNISVGDILDGEIRRFISTKLGKNPVLATRLTFEILESEGIDNFDEVKEFFHDVKQYGCSVAIDDFGSGYSNFGRIMGLDVDYLKIDGSLIKNIHQDDKSAIITESIVNIARRMGIKTVAEFVHCQEVFERSKDLGIDYSQGYYFGAPERHIK